MNNFISLEFLDPELIDLQQIQIVLIVENLPHKHTNTHYTLESEVLRELFQPVLLNSVSVSTAIYTMLRSALHSLDETLQYRN